MPDRAEDRPGAHLLTILDADAGEMSIAGVKRAVVLDIDQIAEAVIVLLRHSFCLTGC